MSDEGYYWETGNEKILFDQFKSYDAAIDSFCEAMEGLSAVPGETAESLGDRLEKLLRDKFGGKKE